MKRKTIYIGLKIQDISIIYFGLLCLFFHSCTNKLSDTPYERYCISIHSNCSTEIFSYDVLPEQIKTSAEKIIFQRVPKDFFLNRMQFVGCQFIDTLDCPESRYYQWEVPIYVLKFEYSDESKGIRRYCVWLEMNSTGELIGSVYLPNIKDYPHKSSFVSLKQVDSILRANNFRNYDYIELTFDTLENSAIWNCEKWKSRNAHWVKVKKQIIIDAHTGVVKKLIKYDD